MRNDKGSIFYRPHVAQFCVNAAHQYGGIEVKGFYCFLIQATLLNKHSLRKGSADC